MHIKIISILVLSLLLNGKAAGASVEEILDNYFKESGGKEKIKSIRGIKAEGLISGDMNAFLITWKNAKEEKTEIDFGERLILTGQDEKGKWRLEPNGRMIYLTGEQLKKDISASLAENFLFYAVFSDNYEKRLLDKKQENETSYYLIEVKTKESLPVILYFNESTGLIDKAVIKDENNKDFLIQEYKEYKEVQGIKMPFRFKSVCGTSGYETLYKNIEINPSFEKSVFDKKDSFSIEIKNESKIVPLPIERNQENEIFVKVKFDGTDQEFTFMLDTGANKSMLSSYVANAVNLDLFGSSRVNAASQVQFTRVKNLSLGELSISNYTFIAGSGIGIDGIIGSDLLSEFVFEVKNRERKVVLYEHGKYKSSDESDKIPIKIMAGLPFVDVRVNDKDKATLLIDTGFTGAELCFYPGFTGRADIETQEGEGGVMGVGGGGGIRIAKVDSVKLGRYCFITTDISVANVRASFDGLIGYSGFLSKFDAVALDYKNKFLYITPKPWLGISYKMNTREETNEIAIERIMHNSPCNKAGLQKGDVILKVADKEIKAMRDISDSIKGLKIGDKIKMSIKREDKIIEKEITLAPLFCSE